MKKKIISLKGVLKGILVKEEDIKDAKKSLFKESSLKKNKIKKRKEKN